MLKGNMVWQPDAPEWVVGETDSWFRETARILKHHDPVKLLRATVHSKKAIKKKETASVAVSCCKIAIGLRPGRLGRMKKLAFLQERNDRFSASGAK